MTAHPEEATFLGIGVRDLSSGVLRLKDLGFWGFGFGGARLGLAPLEG